MEMMDKDGSGEVSLKEFERWWRMELQKNEIRDRARAAGKHVSDSEEDDENYVDPEEIERCEFIAAIVGRQLVSY
jgi:hypothetical protein